jgi:hypothetical protein
VKYIFPKSIHSGLPQARKRIRAGVALPFLLLVSAVSAFGGTFNCTNTGGDASAIQSALNGGGTVTLQGTCAIGSTTLYVGSNVTVNGSATLNYNGSGYVFSSTSGQNDTITGLTLNGGGINLGNSGTPPAGWTITNNTIRNIISTSSGIRIDILGRGAHSTISNNTFSNIWINGYPSNAASRDSAGGCLFWDNGLDNTLVDSNTFSECQGNAIKGFNDGFSGHTNTFISRNVVISNNDIQLEGRIGIEVQGIGKNNCPGGCITGIVSSDGVVVKGNYIHNFVSPVNNQFAYSLMFGSTNSLIINNSAVNSKSSCSVRLALALEDVLNGGLVQGSVFSSVGCGSANTGTGWAMIEGSGYTAGRTTDTFQNNIWSQPNDPHHNKTGPDSPSEVYAYQYELFNQSVPNAYTSETSNIVGAFTSANNQSFPGGGQNTWSYAVSNNISIRNVRFFVDGSTAPIVTQELSDVNTNFATNPKWLYHATLNTSSLSSGTHTLTATATDVSGAKQSASQTFSVGYGGGTPSAQATPGSISFGTQPLGLKTAAQTVTLKNGGTASLTISGIALSGANSADFASSFDCGGTLAAGASCSILVSFTPSAPGSETANLVIGSNAAGSPQSIALSGSGAATPPPPPPPPPPPTTLPTNLPKGMLLWLANDAGIIANASAVSAWEDQSGNGNDAVQSASANQPVVVAGNNKQNALHFDGASSFMSISSLPIDGLTGMTVFLVSSDSKDISSNPSYGSSSFLNWPETANWGLTFFGSYQTSAHFRFGTTQVGNENSYNMPFTRTNSFGLSEWMHAGTTDSMLFNGQSIASYTGKSVSIAGSGVSAWLGQGSYKTFYPGDVSEVIIYSRSLTVAERQLVEQYLMTKYHL